MDSYTLDFVRTSVKKNPEEWVFEEEIESSNQIPSVLNIFNHVPTKYKLLIVYVPEFEISGIMTTQESYYLDLIEPKEYQKKMRDLEGVFIPKIENLSFINENSIIIKTLFYLKNVSKTDENIRRYAKFKSHVNKKIEERKNPNG